MSRLADRCVAAARRSGIDIEDRAFRPHLTLARARRDAVDARDQVAQLSSYEGDVWTVTGMQLVHSTLGAKVRHEPIVNFWFRPHG